MKVVYGLQLLDQEHPLYVERAAELLEKMAAALRGEAAGGEIVSHVGFHVELESGESATLIGIAEKPRKMTPRLVIPS